MNPYGRYPSITFRITDIIQGDAGEGFTVWLAPVDTPSDDGRVIVGDLGWREPPLPFMASDSEMGHSDAVHVGNLTDFSKQTRDGVEWVTAQLAYDTDEASVEFQRLASEGKFNGVSIHMGKVEFWPVIQRDGAWERVSFDELDEMLSRAESEEEVEAILSSIFDGAFDAEIAAATQVAIPAFPDAHIEAPEMEEEAEPVAAGSGISISFTNPTSPAEIMRSIFDQATDSNGEPWEVVLASNLLDRPPADWFTDPELDGPTGLTVTDEGRVFGHLALWDSCHTGYRDRCVPAPRDADYSTFLTSRVITDDGQRVPVGPLVVDDGHAPASWSMDRVMDYYSDTKLAAAYVTVGEDEHGVWVSGAVSHKATTSQIETLRRHPLSGDWRGVDGRYRLIAAVSVNGPGFPVPEVLVASGEPVGLITSGPEPDRPSDLVLVASALEALAHDVAALRSELADQRDAPEVEAEARQLLEALTE